MKAPPITFADVVHQSVSFSPDKVGDDIILALLDTPWVQRLREISQTANTRLVYMFSEHSRFGHSLGVAYLASMLMEKLAVEYPSKVAPYRRAVLAAALLHDVGHLAPGSHTAFKTWFPDQRDSHEELSIRIIQQDPQMQKVLSVQPDLLALTSKILHESDEIPAWTWEIISGGGWNVDRGNWCSVDSVLAGVSYGKYNIPALIESMQITDKGHLAVSENRLDAMMHFAISRHAMYRQIYHHRVILAADMLNKAIVQRARDLNSKLDFADDAMRSVLSATSPTELTLDTIFTMRESWWRYHLIRWSRSTDQILSDLSSRLLNRRLFKTVRIHGNDEEESLLEQSTNAVVDSGFDPKYYLHSVSTSDIQAGDHAQSMAVALEDGRIVGLQEAEPLFGYLVRESKNAMRRWLVIPEEAKRKLGRVR